MSRQKKPSKRFRRLKVIAGFASGILILVYLAFSYALYTRQEQILFPNYGPNFENCSEIMALGYTPVDTIVGGERLRYLWRPGKQARATVLFFHGNGGSVCSRVLHADRLRSEFWNVAFAEYPGYGGGDSKASQENLLRNALAIYDLLAQKTGGHPMILFGKSLGSSVATYVAAERRVAGLILYTPYPSILAVAQNSYSWVPVRLFLKHPFPSEDWARKVACPVLAVHGDSDTLIPLRLGREQVKNFAGSAELVVIPGAGHNDLARRDPQLYWGKIFGFLQNIFEKRR